MFALALKREEREGRERGGGREREEREGEGGRGRRERGERDVGREREGGERGGGEPIPSFCATLRNGERFSRAWLHQCRVHILTTLRY